MNNWVLSNSETVNAASIYLESTIDQAMLWLGQPRLYFMITALKELSKVAYISAM